MDRTWTGSPSRHVSKQSGRNRPLRPAIILPETAKEDVLQKRRDQAVRFTAAVLETAEKVRENKKMVVDHFAQLYKMDEAIISEAFDIYLKSGHYPLDGGMNPGSFKETTQLDVGFGVLKRLPSYDDVYDTTIYQEALALRKEMPK